MVIDIRRDYRSNKEIKMAQEDKDTLMQDFLARGGKVEKLQPGIAKGASSLSRSGKLHWNEEDVKSQAQENKE